MVADASEREERLIALGILAEVRQELRTLDALVRGDDDGREEEEADEG
ncbi:MAG: hypothetical protein OEV72_03840 [Thermoleophilia bacterium]|nr:hypothetical protein [Thermoleophilia bacterium]